MKRIALLMENSRAYGRELIRGIADFTQTQHHVVLEMVDARDLSDPQKVRDFAGVIARVVTREACGVLTAAEIPVVDVLCQFRETGFLCADTDHAAIGALAADFFIGRGFKSYAFFGFDGAAFSDARRAGFVDRLKTSGRDCISFCSETVEYETIFSESTHRNPHARALSRWMKTLPDKTALFCANDIRAYQALRTAEELGLDVPGNLAVLGVDNDPLICAFARPQLSSIDPNAHDLGYSAALKLSEAIKSGGKLKGSLTSTPKGIVERASTQLLQEGPPWLKSAVDFILSNIEKPIATADIVRLSGFSHTSVEKEFRRRFGESCGRYILRMKMNEAKRLIARGNITSKEVAYRVGFTSPQYFCRAFKSFHGHSPFEHLA